MSISTRKKALVDAKKELIAQGILGLLRAGQPEGQLEIQSDGEASVSYRKTENLRAAFPLQGQDLNTRLRRREIIGLGEVMVYMLFLNKVNFNYENLYLDEQNRLIIIDGNEGITQPNKAAPNKITTRIIGELPSLNIQTNLADKYLVNNWPVIDENLYPYLQAEINAAILKVLILPNELIQALVKRIVIDPQKPTPAQENEAEDIYAFILKRKNFQLRAAVLGNIGVQRFIDYLRKDRKKQVEAHLDYLGSLNPSGLSKTFREDMLSSFEGLQTKMRRSTGADESKDEEASGTPQSRSRKLGESPRSRKLGESPKSATLRKLGESPKSATPRKLGESPKNATHRAKQQSEGLAGSGSSSFWMKASAPSQQGMPASSQVPQIHSIHEQNVQEQNVQEQNEQNNQEAVTKKEKKSRGPSCCAIS